MSEEFVGSLTDSELIAQLRKHGVSPGPILSTTRRVYEKKLIRLLGGDSVHLPREEEDTGTDDDEDYVDEIVQEPVPIQIQRGRPREKQPTAGYAPSEFRGTQDVRQRVPQNVQRPKTATRTSKSGGETTARKRTCSIFMQVVVLLIFIAIAFFILQNLETPFINKAREYVGMDQV